MPKFRYEVVERHILEVVAPDAQSIFWNVEEYEDKAELVDIVSFNEAENIREVG